MFVKLKDLKQAFKDTLEEGGFEVSEVKKLKESINDLKSDLAEIRLKKRIEEAELKHLVKMKEEKQEIEAKKRELELQEKYNKKEMELQTEHHGKLLAVIETGRKEAKEFHDKVMERLPNINAEITMKR